MHLKSCPGESQLRQRGKSAEKEAGNLILSENVGIEYRIQASMKHGAATWRFNVPQCHRRNPVGRQGQPTVENQAEVILRVRGLRVKHNKVPNRFIIMIFTELTHVTIADVNFCTIRQGSYLTLERARDTAAKRTARTSPAYKEAEARKAAQHMRLKRQVVGCRQRQRTATRKL
ncbi:unnamed protein product [Gongylonema pulchrum]|uniref:RRXRR domain-containing protein n=1 Tax=Gongylonema pulchrum TaxID=637853 RepID=A0A183E155_9BILA|nr:unnamed protein product [Gongylonema pulchrum]